MKESGCDQYVAGAITWARSKLGSTDYPLLCLSFVEACYEKGNGIEVFGGSSAAGGPIPSTQDGPPLRDRKSTRLNSSHH